nr:MAG TPA: hypothetical protein [Caudoviricetes sp.]
MRLCVMLWYVSFEMKICMVFDLVHWLWYFVVLFNSVKVQNHNCQNFFYSCDCVV